VIQPLYQPIRPNREALGKQIAQQLEQLIFDERLLPGDKLPPERDLSDQFGVSRTAVRDAIQSLVSRGLLVSIHGRGTFVAEANPGMISEAFRLALRHDVVSIRNLHQFREIFEPEIAALAALSATEKDIRLLEDAFKAMQDNFNSPEAYAEADLHFHQTLTAATQNNLFYVLVLLVVDLLQKTRHLILQDEGAALRAQKHHADILQAIRRKDPVAARRAMNDHITQIQGELKNAGIDPLEPHPVSI
jgi:GntR family transcriptional repressor for pyruvate dehydrogenase complex